MIRSANAEERVNSATLDKNSFRNMMLPFMQNELNSQQKSLEELKGVFLDADIDGSGYLSVDELYQAVRKIGADVELEDVIDLMSELDVDRNG